MTPPFFSLLYEDNHLVIINKPAGLLTQKGEGQELSATEYVKEYLKQKYSKSGEVFLHAIHRLDRCTSGIVIFAKSSKALERMNKASRENKLQKIYYAAVEGTNLPQEGSLTHYLLHGDHKAIVVDASHPQGKRCCLTYKTVSVQKESTLVAINLETGRYHQIRAQFAAYGHPVVGDAKYGSRMAWAPGGIALHHKTVEFTHPVTGVAMKIEAEPTD